MTRRWQRGRIGVLGLSIAAIAAAAVPDEAGLPAPADGPGAPAAVAGPRPGPQAPRLDMARLRRLQPAAAMPARAEAAPADPAAEGADPAAAPPAPEIVNAFGVRSWYVPPPPPPPARPAPPPKPTAPPLPFRYVGNYDDLDKPPVALLLRGDRLYAVTAGDAIDGTYRVERIEAGLVELTYLPLQQKQVLHTGEAG